MFLDNINKVDKFLKGLIRKTIDKIQVTNIKNERGSITIEFTNLKRQ